MEYGNNLNKFQTNKKVFLEDSNYSENTKIKYWRVLSSTFVNLFEKTKDKDLYNFTKREIEDLINSNATTRRSSQTQMLTIVSRYIDWSIERGLLTTGINPCHTIYYWEDIGNNNLLVKSSYTTIEEFSKFVDDLYCSDVDKLLLIMIRYGIKVKETKFIKHEQLDIDNMTLRVYSDSGVIDLPIDDLFLEYYNRAKKCDSFEVLGKEGYKTTNYIDSGYMIKNTTRGKGDIVNDNSLRNRLYAISLNNNITRIPVNVINRNRYYDLLFDIRNKKGYIEYNDIDNVVKILNGSSSGNQRAYLKKDWESLTGDKVRM